MSLMNKREIDRFMYGNYSAELTPNVGVVNHTKDSLKLVGPPVAKLDRNCPMKGINAHIRAKMISCDKISNDSSTHIIHLVPDQSEVNFKFEGFE